MSCWEYEVNTRLVYELQDVCVWLQACVTGQCVCVCVCVSAFHPLPCPCTVLKVRFYYFAIKLFAQLHSKWLTLNKMLSIDCRMVDFCTSNYQIIPVTLLICLTVWQLCLCNSDSITDLVTKTWQCVLSPKNIDELFNQLRLWPTRLIFKSCIEFTPK